MANQRITIVKVGGIAGDHVAQRLREWSAMRQSIIPKEWLYKEWPPEIRSATDELADRLRAHGYAPPAVHFVEWCDMWSMADTFGEWLTPHNGPMPFFVEADRYEVFVYSLPDNGRLARHLLDANPQQFAESVLYIQRLREAVAAWDKLVDRAALVVLRYVISATVSDEEVTASLSRLPAWLSPDAAGSNTEPSRE